MQLKGELGFQELLWQSKGATAYDCGCEIRGLHHLFIVFSVVECWPMVLETTWFRAAV